MVSYLAVIACYSCMTSPPSPPDAVALLEALLGRGVPIPPSPRPDILCFVPGIVCAASDEEAGRPYIAAVNLPGRGLAGTLPAAPARQHHRPFISSLAKLRILNLYNNSVAGEIPGWVYGLPELEVLDLCRNRLSGDVAGSFAGRLRELCLCHNTLGGVLDPGVLEDGCGRVERVLLQGNRFKGRLPRLSRLEKAREVDLSDNNFTGPLPVLHLPLPDLTALHLHRNRLTDTLPWDFLTGAGAALTSLSLSDNSLTGTLPGYALSRLLGLTHLSLDGNALEGEIPASLSNLNRLQLLRLGGNRFRGGLPRGVASLPSLKLVTFDEDSRPGADQRAGQDPPAVQILLLCCCVRLIHSPAQASWPFKRGVVPFACLGPSLLLLYVFLFVCMAT